MGPVAPFVGALDGAGDLGRDSVDARMKLLWSDADDFVIGGSTPPGNVAINGIRMVDGKPAFCEGTLILSVADARGLAEMILAFTETTPA